MVQRLSRFAILAVLAGAGYAFYRYESRPPTALVLTGIVTTNDVIVSPQIGGKLDQLMVLEGDTVKKDQMLATISPAELMAEQSAASQNVQGLASQVRESEAALRYQERQTADQIRQAQSTLESIQAQQEAATADFENARLTYDRTEALSKQNVVSAHELDVARTQRMGAEAKVSALKRQAEAQAAAVALARSSAEQIAVRRNQVQLSGHQQAAASAQAAKADVRLAYTEIKAPVDGIVDVRAARSGEIVNPGQPIVTLINPDDLWVRADVEETYIDRLRIGDRFTVRLPSGEERQGVVFFRGVDAGYATQRDVSRTKRDIKTFEVRLRCDNTDRRLAVGMTAYVMLPLN